MARMPVTAADSQSVPETIEAFIPSRLFHGLAVPGSTWWTPRRLLLASALMSWREREVIHIPV